MVAMIHTSGDDGRPKVSFNRDTAKKFKHDYEMAVACGLDCFQWQGHPFLVGYAKYLVEYLEMQFGKL